MEQRRPRPLLASLYTDPASLSAFQAKQSSPLETWLWSVCPMSSRGPPRPVLPTTDEERVSEIDHQALANLRSFDGQPVAYPSSTLPGISVRSPDRVVSSLSSLQPHGAYFEGRRHSVASPSSPTALHPGFNSPVLPLTAGPARRRRSAPSVGAALRYAHFRRGSQEPGTHCVVPKQLDRPLTPVKLPCGMEIWWPIQPNGDVKVHVAVISRSGVAEKLTKCFDSVQLQTSAHLHASSNQTPAADGTISYPAPGSVLPVPGSLPQTPSSSVSSERRLSFACSPTPISPRSGRRASHHEFPGEYIGALLPVILRSCLGSLTRRVDKDHAMKLLPILGAILLQTKRPIQGDEIIHLPLPFPSAWFETVRYVYTGDSEFLSESVKRNISHLGGKI